MSEADWKLARWGFILEEFDLDVVSRSGIFNRAAAALSRLDSDAAEPTEIHDDIPKLPVIAYPP